MRQNISLLKYLLGILPHGIFELTALILSAAMGLYLCSTVTNALRKKQTGVLRPALHRCCQILYLWILPLLFMAALVETYITPIQFGIIDIKAPPPCNLSLGSQCAHWLWQSASPVPKNIFPIPSNCSPRTREIYIKTAADAAKGVCNGRTHQAYP